MPVQIWEAVKWVIVISTAGGWLMLLVRVAYKYFIEDEGDKKK